VNKEKRKKLNIPKMSKNDRERNMVTRETDSPKARGKQTCRTCLGPALALFDKHLHDLFLESGAVTCTAGPLVGLFLVTKK
jgi:hypothetical protein